MEKAIVCFRCIGDRRLYKATATPSSVVLVDRRFGGEDELVEEPEGPTAGVGG